VQVQTQVQKRTRAYVSGQFEFELAKVYPIRKNGNLLLRTLLLGNVAVNSAMVIFLGNIAKDFRMVAAKRMKRDLLG